MGWVRHDGERFHLTDAGRRTFEKDEGEVDCLFFASWPPVAEADLNRLLDLTRRLNQELI